MDSIKTEIKTELKQNLNKYLKQSGKIQKDLVEFLSGEDGKGKGKVSGWFSGDILPKILEVPSICQFLDISVSDLFGRFSNDKSLTEEEKALLREFRLLSDEGQRIAIECFGFLAFKYKKDCESGVLEKEA